MEERIVSPLDQDEDLFENNLRPRRLEDYLGQVKVKENIDIFIQATKKRRKSAQTQHHDGHETTTLCERRPLR